MCELRRTGRKMRNVVGIPQRVKANPKQKSKQKIVVPP